MGPSTSSTATVMTISFCRSIGLSQECKDTLGGFVQKPVSNWQHTLPCGAAPAAVPSRSKLDILSFREAMYRRRAQRGSHGHYTWPPISEAAYKSRYGQQMIAMTRRGLVYSSQEVQV